MENNTFKETTINDYIPKIHEKFPEVSEEDIKKIISYGWRLIYVAVIFGCDVLILSQSNNFWFYIGNLGKNPLRHFNYYKIKLLRKMKFIFKRNKPNWDGYYYTSLTDEEAKQFNEMGRKRKYFTFNKKLSFKYKDASQLYYTGYQFIIKYKSLIDRGFEYYSEELKVTNPELLKIKPVKSFQDVLIINNDYELL